MSLISFFTETKRVGNEHTDVLIKETRAVWEEAYSYCVSKDEAGQILANMSDFFALLHKWDQQSNASCSDDHGAEESTGGEHAA